VTSPANGSTLPLASAGETRLELAVDAKLLPSVEVSLDGARARPVTILPEVPKLSDLGELREGEHYLVASLRSSPDSPALRSVVRFGVGGPPSSAPLIFCSRPEGTVYAPAGATLLLDFVTDGFQPGKDGSVRVRIEAARGGNVRFESLLASADARHFTLPGSDDFAVELSLVDASGQLLPSKFGRDRCEVTRNEVGP
jgi:hypothetical protein